MRRMIKPGKARQALFILLVLLITSCRTSSGLISKNPQVSVSYTIEKIDLTEADLQLLTNVPDFTPLYPKTFARKSGAELVINTTPFKKNGSPVGLVIYRGKVLAPAQKKYAALAFFKDASGSGYKAEIFDSQTELFEKYGEAQLPELAMGGFWTILRDGKEYEFIDHKDFRTAVGICDGGKRLLILVGKKLSYGDCAKIFKEAGAEVAMEFDGGRSAQMVINGKNLLPGIKRKVPVVLGFKTGY